MLLHPLLSLKQPDNNCGKKKIKKIVPQKPKFVAEPFACFSFACHCSETGEHKPRTYREVTDVIYLSAGKQPEVHGNFSLLLMELHY